MAILIVPGKHNNSVASYNDHFITMTITNGDINKPFIRITMRNVPMAATYHQITSNITITLPNTTPTAPA